MKGIEARKRYRLLVVVVLVLLSLTFLYWSITTPKLTSISADKVSKIEIRNGSTGELKIIKDKENIERLINNFNSIAMKRKNLSKNYVGYSFSIKIYKNSGEVYKSFSVNTEDSIRKDPFFYKVIKNKVDVDYMKRLFE